MASIETPEQVIHRFAQLLDDADVPYMLTGSFASGFHGAPRATQDAMVLVASEYHVRVLGEFCDGEIVEIRDVENTYARPRFPRKGQIGFDCTEDASVFQTPPDLDAIQHALRARVRSLAGVRVRHTVFPNSSSPLIKEEQVSSGRCARNVYLTASP